MKSIFIGLSLISAATAQIVNGLSSVPVTAVASASAQSAATPAPSASATPPPTQPSSGVAAQYTAPPAPGQDFYSYMPYSSMSSGGYSQLQCGYGYQKQGDGSCTQLSWVSVLMMFIFGRNVDTPDISTSPRFRAVMQQSSSTSTCISKLPSQLFLTFDTRGSNYGSCDNSYGYGAQTVTVTNYVTQVFIPALFFHSLFTDMITFIDSDGHRYGHDARDNDQGRD
jgi:hypothetical protein